jgi:PAS domain S-box-containing protein
VDASAAWAYFFVGLAAIVLDLALSGQVGTYDAIGLATTGAIFVGVALHRPVAWRAWFVVGVSQALMTAGDIVYDHFTDRHPGPADALYLSAVAMLIVGLVMLAGSAPRGAASANLDAMLVTVAFGIVAWVFVFGSIESSATLDGKLVSYAYPIADMCVLGLVIRLLLVGGRRYTAYRLLLAAVLLLFLGDGAWVVPALDGTYAGTTWPDAAWLGSYVLLGAAALHPSMRRPIVTRPQIVEDSTIRVLVIGTAIVAAPLAVVVADLMGRTVDLQAACGAGTVLMVIVVARFALIVRDLGRLHREAVASERKFRLLFERAPIGISIGRDGIMSETNPALQHMLGYTAEEFASMHYTQVTHQDDRELDAQIDLDLGHQTAFSANKRYVTKDGRTVDTRAHVALEIADGLGISVIEDIGPRRRLEEQLRDAQKMEAVGKLAGGVAHDFNNLMTAVLGYSDLVLKRLAPDDENRGKIEAIRESAVRASDLTRQLLAFGRRQMLQTTDVDLRDAVGQMEELLGSVLGDDVLFESDLGDEPLVVRADPTQLEQVVMNLAVNARDAMPNGGMLRISATSDGTSAVLSVADTGSGMDENTLARAFEPFFTTKHIGDGAGLGLATVHGIVGQSGGTIEAESEPGHGTTFTIRLPLVRKPGLPHEHLTATLLTD